MNLIKLKKSDIPKIYKNSKLYETLTDGFTLVNEDESDDEEEDVDYIEIQPMYKPIYNFRNIEDIDTLEKLDIMLNVLRFWMINTFSYPIKKRFYKIIESLYNNSPKNKIHKKIK